MSSPLTQPYTQAPIGARVRLPLNGRNAFFPFGLFVGALFAVVTTSHLFDKSLVASGYFGATLVGCRLLGFRPSADHESPVDIANTAVAIRRFLFALAATAVVAVSVHGLGAPSYKLLLSFVCFETIQRFPAHELSFGALKEERARPGASYATLKRCADLVLSLVSLLLLAPLLGLIAACVKAGGHGPVFFCQERVGLHGRRFCILKFRTMHVGSAPYDKSPADENDPRITRVGGVLRRFSLDELPQLFNVLRGDMSIVGPRPEMPFIVRRYNRRQRERLQVPPGLTGLWQISPARAFPIHEHIEFDLYYIAHRSLLLDLAIMFRTAGAVFRGIGAA